MLLGLVKRQICAQFGFDLVIPWQRLDSSAPSCFAALRFARAKSSMPSSAMSRAAAAAMRARVLVCLFVLRVMRLASVPNIAQGLA